MINGDTFFILLSLFTLVVIILCYIIYKQDKRIQILEENSEGMITILKAIQEGKEFQVVVNYNERN